MAAPAAPAPAKAGGDASVTNIAKASGATPRAHSQGAHRHRHIPHAAGADAMDVDLIEPEWPDDRYVRSLKYRCTCGETICDDTNWCTNRKCARPIHREAINGLIKELAHETGTKDLKVVFNNSKNSCWNNWHYHKEQRHKELVKLKKRAGKLHEDKKIDDDTILCALKTAPDSVFTNKITGEQVTETFMNTIRWPTKYSANTEIKDIENPFWQTIGNLLTQPKLHDMLRETHHNPSWTSCVRRTVPIFKIVSQNGQNAKFQADQEIEELKSS